MCGRMGAQVVQLGFTVVLARTLSPREFGAIGMLVVFTGFAQLLADSGLGSALIHKEKLTEQHRVTAFWMQLVVGLFLSATFMLAAPLFARFYNLPLLKSMTRLVSVVFAIQAAGQTHYALLAREFRFQRVAVANISATVVSGTIAVALALNGYGVWALVWQMIAFAAANAVLYTLFSEWRLHFGFERAAALELGRYAIYVLGFNSLNYWARNGDNLTIGKVLGSPALGIYSRAYNLMLLPITNVSSVLGQVFFPALSRLQNDLLRFRQVYLSAIQMIALFTFPLMAGMSVLSRPLIDVLFGAQWVAMVPLLKVLSLIGLVQSIVNPVGWIFNSLGKTKIQFQISAFLLLAFATAILIGIRHGLLGVVYAYALWAVLSSGTALHFAGRLIHLSIGDVVRGLSRILGMTAVMAIFVYCVDNELARLVTSALRLVLGSLIGAGAYLALCVALRDETFASLRRHMMECKQTTGGGAAGPKGLEEAVAVAVVTEGD